MLTAVVVGVLFEKKAGMVLAPALALGMLVLGIAHGACDQLVLPSYNAPAGGWPWLRYLIRVLLGYLGLAGVMAGL